MNVLLNNDLVRLHKVSKKWFCEQALPFWIERGSADIGAHYERLGGCGKVDLICSVRTRVQFRQIYTFAVAYEKTWLASGLKHALAVQGFVTSNIENTHTNPNYLSYPHLLHNDFSLCDNGRDLYDHAFCLLSLAALYKASHDPTFLKKAHKVFSFIDNTWSSSDGGWFEGEVLSAYRTQNAHMHLFEAFLSWYEASLDPIWLERAQLIFTLFCEHFYQPELGVIFEYFEHDWCPINNEELQVSRQVVEPGHMFEWVCLLHWYQRLCPKILTSEVANKLYSQAIHLGVEKGSGLVVDQLNSQGKVLQRTKRLWPMTEYLKASLAQAQFYRAHPNLCSNLKVEGTALAFEQNACAAINSICRYFIHPAHSQGMFVDQVGQDNEVINNHMLGSTFYHLSTALLSLEDYLDLPEAKREQTTALQQKKECDVYL